MYNLANHFAYDFFKVSGVISEIINALLQESNYCYLSFNKKIESESKNVADELYDLIQPGNPLKDSIPYYSTKHFNDKQELASKLKGDMFELFVMFFLQYFDKFPAVFGIKEGTYVQMSDEEDAGMDFYGIKGSSGKNERIFGQIKYRNPDIPMKEENKCFTRTVVNKLIGDATIKKGFNLNNDYLLLVTNRTLEDSIHYRVKDEIGFVNGAADSEHSYIKFIDANTFQINLGFNQSIFWTEFRNQFI